MHQLAPKVSSSDAFITKLNAAGSALIYSTYLGGSGNDSAKGIATNTNGTYIVGDTSSANFITTPGVVQSNIGSSSSDLFVTRLNESSNPVYYAIRGKVIKGVSGQPLPRVTVTLSGSLSRTTTTSPDGTFFFSLLSAGGNYTITPDSAYNCAPLQRTYLGLGNNVTDADFAASQLPSDQWLTISGRVRNVNRRDLSATVRVSGDLVAAQSVSGFYSFDVPIFGAYTVSAERAPVASFSAQSFISLSQNTSNVDFDATFPLVTVTGQLTNLTQGAASVQINVGGTGLTSKPCDVTTQNGAVQYVCADLSIYGDYTVVPASTTYNFNPTIKNFFEIPGNVVNANFAAQIGYSISGRVTEGAAGLAGVLVTLSGSASRSTTTDASGNYAFVELTTGGNYTVTPSLANYTFAPPNQPFTNLNANQTANFAATRNTYAISGQVTGGGVGLSGVTVTLSGAASATTTTNTSGNYSFAGLAAGGNFTVTPSNTAQYSFTAQTVNALQANQTLNFAGTLRTYTVSGQVTTGSAGLSGVTVTLTGPAGFTPRTFTTAADGNYSFAGVPAGSNYTVQAARTNYTVTPANIAVTNLLADRTGANFAGTLQTFTISGRVTVGTSGLSGTTLTLSGGQTGTTQTDASGNYSFAGLAAGSTYTVTPTKTNYSFVPANRSFPNLSGNQTGDFAGTLATFTISGQVTAGGTGLSGVTVNLSGGQTATAQTDANGNYSFPNLAAGGNYTITPTKANYSFTPASQSFNNLVSNQTGANFAGTLGAFVISGRITVGTNGLAGVTVTLSGSTTGTAQTDASGNYSFGVAAGGTYTVTPAKSFYSFNVANQTFANLTANQTANFSATLLTFSLSGRVSVGASGLRGVTLTLSGDRTDTTTTNANGDYTFAALPGGSSLVVTPTLANYTFAPPSQTVNVDSERPNINFTATAVPAQVQFSVAGYQVGEGDRQATITVTRTGDTLGTSTVDYNTVDTDNFTVNCAATQGAAFGRCDFATSLDTLTFAPGETSKTFDVPIINDARVEGNETFQVVLSNPTGAILGTPMTATVTITDNDAPGAANPINTTPLFVRQQYLDFLAREPEASEPYSNILNNCADVNTGPDVPSGCDRITVSGAFFGSPEFKDKGIYLIVFYRVAFNRRPTYAEFAPDLRSVTGATPDESFAKRAAFARTFTQRPEFTSAYSGMSDAAYVAALLRKYQLAAITAPDPQNPDGILNPDGTRTIQKVTLTQAELVSRLGSGALTRAQALRAIVQSDQISANAEAVNAFVDSQYYGYLRRTPDTAGFNGWVNYLATHPGDFRTMVNGFVNSDEYRLRFGQQ